MLSNFNEAIKAKKEVIEFLRRGKRGSDKYPGVEVRIADDPNLGEGARDIIARALADVLHDDEFGERIRTLAGAGVLFAANEESFEARRLLKTLRDGKLADDYDISWDGPEADQFDAEEIAKLEAEELEDA